LSFPSAGSAEKAVLSKRRRVSAEFFGTRVNRYLEDFRRPYDWLITEDRIRRQDNSFDGIKGARTTTNHKRAPTARHAGQLLDLEKPGSIDELTWRMMPLLARPNTLKRPTYLRARRYTCHIRKI